MLTWPPRSAPCSSSGGPFGAGAQEREDPHAWEVHDPNRPQPPVVEPGRSGSEDPPGHSPSDAIRRAFGDVQLHVEWAAPVEIVGEGQGRGNSGIFLMDRYEVQVLDSYDNVTYPDGQAAAVYGQYPPLANAMRPPGEWNAFDIVFRRPRFDADGGLVRPARITVFHNGVLVQDGVSLTGPTAHTARPGYATHPDRLPISLQDHGKPVRFRNIWVRELE